MKSPDTVMLIDGKNCAYRHHYTRLHLSAGNGFPTSVLYGCPSAMISLSKRLPGVPMVWVWDGAGRTWRHRITDDVYKAHRRVPGGIGAKDNPEVIALHRQLPILKQFFKDIGIRCFEVYGLEGDDLIGLLTTHILQKDLFRNVIIHSSDRDFYQFIGPRVRVLKKIEDNELVYASRDDIQKEFGIPITKWLQYRAIVGDHSDNIPGIFKGVGPKTAAQWVADGLDASKEKFGGFASTIRCRGKEYDIRGSWEALHANYQLCHIVRDWKDKHLSRDVREKLEAMFTKLNTKSFCRRQSKLTEESWRGMTKFLASYGMEELMSKRHTLWNLP